MGLFDSAADALKCVEEGESYRLTDGRSEYSGYPWGDLQKIKLELHVICMKESYPYPIFEDADYDWLRAEVLKRAAKKPPDQLKDVFSSCVKKLWKKRFPTKELLEARCRELGE
jgi:hypothetical protein